MPFKVLLTHDAARDLDELYDYITLHDAARKADYVLEQIEKAFSKLSKFPERGAYPKELLLFFNPDRFLGVGPRDQARRLLLVAAAVLIAGPPDDDAAVGIKADIGAPKRVDLRLGKAQIGNLRPGVV
jgi:plasmid stabilization system protein ParE